MKILCVIDNLSSGGSQRQLVNLAIGFKEKGNIVSFLTYHNIPFYNPIIEKNGILIYCIQDSNYLKRLLKIRRFIRRGNYDAVVSFLDAPNFICEVSGLPSRTWKLVIGERSTNHNISKSIKLIMYRWFHVFADYVVTNSFANMKIIQSVNPILSKSKCKVIYNIVDFNFWKPSLDYFPRKDGKLKLVVIASHQFLKNLNGLIDALASLNNFERSKIEVDWYGERVSEPFVDDSFPLAKQKISSLKLNDLVKFYPPTHEIIQKIQDADAVGLFSFYEGLPNTVCEGMACGKTIICSAISDLSTLLSHDDNLLCNPSDPKSIANAIKYLLNLSNDQLIKIGEKNMVIAKKNFEKEILINEYLKLLIQ